MEEPAAPFHLKFSALPIGSEDNVRKRIFSVLLAALTDHKEMDKKSFGV